MKEDTEVEVVYASILSASFDSSTEMTVVIVCLVFVLLTWALAGVMVWFPAKSTDDVREDLLDRLHHNELSFPHLKDAVYSLDDNKAVFFADFMLLRPVSVGRIRYNSLKSLAPTSEGLQNTVEDSKNAK